MVNDQPLRWLGGLEIFEKCEILVPQFLLGKGTVFSTDLVDDGSPKASFQYHLAKIHSRSDKLPALNG